MMTRKLSCGYIGEDGKSVMLIVVAASVGALTSGNWAWNAFEGKAHTHFFRFLCRMFIEYCKVVFLCVVLSCQCLLSSMLSVHFAKDILNTVFASPISSLI